MVSPALGLLKDGGASNEQLDFVAEQLPEVIGKLHTRGRIFDLIAGPRLLSGLTKTRNGVQADSR